MFRWTSTIICVLLLQTAQSQAQTNSENEPVEIEKDWNITRAYIDVFKILSNPNTCSEFYGGSRTATTVLNGLVIRVKTQPLLREVSFQMAGSPRIIRDPATGAFYRLFEKTTVNINGSFYQRRAEPMRKFPSDVGDFAPGSRPARALILLHELGHLIQGENGDWLIPDDGFNGEQSKVNTLRVQQVCRKELSALK
ncbi:MAG TPA: hypothetical protein VLB46_04495 [Pyrinomonadaceae bacterium]|nr:hypothetical protein [Pyrinomonadaceae bacterium]